jgi:multiple sugar transport system substrate-binding protein
MPASPRPPRQHRSRWRRSFQVGAASALGVALLAGCNSAGSSASPSNSGASSATTAAGSSGTSGSGTSTTSTTIVYKASCKSGATPLTLWDWVPGANRNVALFNKTHPGICVTLENVGAGAPEYTKLVDALKAGSGAPDVAEVEYDELPSFEITHNVVNLATLGASSLKSDFVPWVWKEVSQGSDVWALPNDSGPMGLYYNSVELAKYHMTPPTTWAQFATDAATLHKDDPKVYMTNFAATDLQWMLSLMSQDDAYPFGYTGGSNVTINFTGAKQMAFAAYWQKLLNAHEVNSETDLVAESEADLDNGTDATWPISAWGPAYFGPTTVKSTGDWRVAPLPQWSSTADVAANWGGSSYPIFTTSKHKAAAYTFVKWMTASVPSWNLQVVSPTLNFPTYVPSLQSSLLQNTTAKVSGSSKPNKVFAAAAPKIQSVEWPPFMTEALTDATTTFAGVLNGKETIAKAFAAFQSQMVSYAKQEGFKVTT